MAHSLILGEMFVKLRAVDDAWGRMPRAPKVQVLETHEVVFQRQRRDPQIAVPDQFAQNRLIFREIVFPDDFAPALDQIDDLRAAPERDDPAIELRNRVGQGFAPKGVTSLAVAYGVMRHGHVETVENLEHVSDIGDHQQIRVKIQGLVEAAEGHGVHLGPVPRIF